MSFNVNTIPKFVEWQAPPAEADAHVKKSWCDELVQNGDRFIQSQPGAAAVLGLPDERLGEEVACVVMIKPGPVLKIFT